MVAVHLLFGCLNIRVPPGLDFVEPHSSLVVLAPFHTSTSIRSPITDTTSTIGQLGSNNDRNLSPPPGVVRLRRRSLSPHRSHLCNGRQPPPFDLLRACIHRIFQAADHPIPGAATTRSRNHRPSKRKSLATACVGVFKGGSGRVANRMV